MKKLLRIDCSSRIEGSHSRKLANYFEQKWLEATPDGRVIYRDLTDLYIPHIKHNTIEGFYTPKELMSADLLEATELSDQLLTELKSADDLLISSPLYNLNIPSNLKAYIDQVVRIGQTFKVDENGYQGLLTDIEAHIITVKGGIMKGTVHEQFDFQEPYLEAILNFMGIQVENLFSLEGTARKNLIAENTKLLQENISRYFANPK